MGKCCPRDSVAGPGRKGLDDGADLEDICNVVDTPLLHLQLHGCRVEVQDAPCAPPGVTVNEGCRCPDINSVTACVAACATVGRSFIPRTGRARN